MFHGFTESPEKIAKRKARICAGAVVGRSTVATESKSRTLVDDLLQTIEQARGELDVRKLYIFEPQKVGQ